MKLKLSLVGIALFATQAFALTAQNVERQIQEIQNLPVQQRVEKMNELKSELRNMNVQERHEIIKGIFEKFHREHTETESHMRNGKKHEKMGHKEGYMNRDHKDVDYIDRDHMDRDHMDRDHRDRGDK